MTVDLHTSQIQGFFDGPVDHLFALPLLAQHVGSRVDRSRLTIVSPDAGRVRVAERWTDTLNAPLAIIHKRRDPFVANEVKVHEVVGDVEGRTCVLVDDMIDTGRHDHQGGRRALRQRRRRGRSSRPPTRCSPARPSTA